MELKEILQIINSDEFINIENSWLSIDLSTFEDKQNVFDRNISGIYALYHKDYGFIYVGKAKRIFDRLKSHCYATQGNEKAECWREFFMGIKGNIIAYWYPLESRNNEQREENVRQILERLIQLKYDPLFDKIYPRGQRKSKPNLHELLEGYCKKGKMIE